MDEKTALINSINQLIVGCTPYIRDVQSLEDVRNGYLHMEEGNKDFHKYAFVKTVRSDIEKVLGPMIEAEIERYRGERTHPAARNDNLVASVTSRVLNSSEYGEMSERIRKNVSGACNHILENFHKEVFVSADNRAGTESAAPKEFCSHDRRYGTEPMYSDAESSIGDNSLNHSAVIFMSPDQQKQVALNLRQINDIAVRKEAITELLQVTSFDIHNCDVWPVIRAGLVSALADDDEDLCSQSLRFIARGLSTNNACSRELYILLVEFLDAEWKSQRLEDACLDADDGLDTTQPYVKKLLKSFRLLNSFQQLVPHYWQRYPEGCLDKILRPTISLLANYSACANPALRFTPLHFMALVDCKANWFNNTMHGHSSRSPLLQMLGTEEYRHFVSSAVLSCLNFVSLSDCPASHANDRPSPPERRLIYGEREVKFAHFLHCLCIVRRLIIYKHGRKFFPVRYDGGTELVGLTQLLETLVRFVTHDSAMRHRCCEADDDFNPCSLIIDMIKKLCTSEDVCSKTVCKDCLIRVLITPITASKDGKVSHTILAHVADILSSIASKRCGQRVLLYGESCTWQSAVSSSSPVHVLADFAQKALNDDDMPRRVVGSLLFVCRQLYGTCEGLLQLYQHKLHIALTTAWKVANREGDCPTPTASIEWSAGESLQPDVWADSLQDDLLNFAATPKGVLLLQQTGVMCDCVSYMYSRLYHVSHKTTSTTINPSL